MPSIAQNAASRLRLIERAAVRHLYANGIQARYLLAALNVARSDAVVKPGDLHHSRRWSFSPTCFESLIRPNYPRAAAFGVSGALSVLVTAALVGYGAGKCVQLASEQYSQWTNRPIQMAQQMAQASNAAQQSEDSTRDATPSPVPWRCPSLSRAECQRPPGSWPGIIWPVLRIPSTIQTRP
jgi:hypothetical protein